MYILYLGFIRNCIKQKQAKKTKFNAVCRKNNYVGNLHIYRRREQFCTELQIYLELSITGHIFYNKAAPTKI